jgi:prolyl-tRNA editing enzyme YbaK/EbsC (Cys-tRNA(Pro) deacylase)
MTQRVQRLLDFVQAVGVEATLVEHGAPMPTVEQAARALGVAREDIVKSILFEEKRGERRALLAVASGMNRVSASKLAQAAGFSSLRLAPGERVLAVTGYPTGGVPPVAHASPLRVLVDARLSDRDVVYAGGADEHHMLRIRPGDIVRLTNATVADIVEGAASDARVGTLQRR